MRIFTGALVIAAFVLSGCGGTTSSQPTDTSVQEQSCAGIVSEYEERYVQAQDLAEEIEGLSEAERTSIVRINLERERDRVVLSAGYLVMDNVSCFDPGDVADWKTIVLDLEKRFE